MSQKCHTDYITRNGFSQQFLNLADKGIFSLLLFIPSVVKDDTVSLRLGHASLPCFNGRLGYFLLTLSAAKIINCQKIKNFYKKGIDKRISLCYYIVSLPNR